MAHPKLATAMHRSLLAISSMALVAGPMAVAGSAQTVEGVTDSTGKIVEDLTCEEARETEDDELIEEFCPTDEPAKNDREKSDPVDDAVDKVERAANDAKETVEKAVSPDSDDDEPSGDGGSTDGGGVIPGGGGGDGDGGAEGGDGKGDGGGKADGSSDRQVSAAGENPRGIEAGPQNQHSSDNSARPADSAGYSTGGGFGGGYRSQSALTLQPFAAPLVSVPPVYEFPQIAEQLLTGDEAVATAGEPMLAPDGTVITPSTTAVNSYSNGATGTPADPTGWLAATATGLIMLVGAAHALNGGRTPRRAEA